jgi:hypothetical protein
MIGVPPRDLDSGDLLAAFVLCARHEPRVREGVVADHRGAAHDLEPQELVALDRRLGARADVQGEGEPAVTDDRLRAEAADEATRLRDEPLDGGGRTLADRHEGSRGRVTQLRRRAVQEVEGHARHVAPVARVLDREPLQASQASGSRSDRTSRHAWSRASWWAMPNSRGCDACTNSE